MSIVYNKPDSNFAKISLGKGNPRYKGGVGYITIGGQKVPVYGAVVGQARYSGDVNAGRQSASSFFGLNRFSKAQGRYTSANAMAQRMTQYMQKQNKNLMSSSYYLNPRYGEQMRNMQSRLNWEGNRNQIGQERFLNNQLQITRPSGGIMGAAVENYWSQSKGNRRRATRIKQANDKIIADQIKQFKGYTPTTANVQFRESLI